MKKEWRALCLFGGRAGSGGRTLLSAKYYQSALEIANQMGISKYQNLSLLYLARSLIRSGDYREAIERLGEISLDDTTVSKLPSIVVTAYAEIDLATGEPTDAMHRLLDFCEAENESNSVPTNHVFEILGRVFLELGDVDRAEQYFNQLLKRGDRIRARSLITSGYLGAAEIALRRNDVRLGISILDQRLKRETVVAKRINLLKSKMNCLLATDDVAALKIVIDQLSEHESKLDAERMADEAYFIREQNIYRQTILDQEIGRRELTSDRDRLLADLRQRKTLMLMAGLLALGIPAIGFLYLKRRLAEKEIDAQQRLLAQQERLNAELTEQIQLRVSEVEQQKKEQLRLETQLSNKRRDEAIGQLTGGVAHDFNNLIMVIEQVNSHLEQNLRDESHRGLRELLTCSSKAARSAADITKRLLAYAKQQNLMPAPIHLPTFFEEYKLLLSQTVNDRVQFELTIDSNDAYIFADPTQLLTALINLCSNSMKAFRGLPSDRLSIIVRRVSRQTFDSWSLKLERSQSMRSVVFVSPVLPHSSNTGAIVISVSDSGAGMTSDQLQRACDPFFSECRRGHGTGLGLSVVKGFLAQSNAGLQISSRAMTGTTVRMIFPEFDGQTPADTQSTESETILPHFDCQGLSVMLVDANEPLRRSLASSISSMGCRVKSFPGGTAAIDALKSRERFDFVLSDADMADPIDGIEFASWLKTNMPHLPLVLMSEGLHESPTYGLGVLRKPFSTEQLVNRLAEMNIQIQSDPCILSAVAATSNNEENKI